VSYTISLRDQIIARRFHLGVPTRKFHFDPPRYSIRNPFYLSLLLCCIAFSGIASISYGLYILTTSVWIFHQDNTWLWLVAILFVPLALALVFYRYGNKRLALLSVVGEVVSLLVVILLMGSTLMAQTHSAPLLYGMGGFLCILLGGLMLSLVGYLAPFSSSLLICTDGCLFVSKLQRRKVIRWEQISALHLNSKRTKIVCSDGSIVNLRGSWTLPISHNSPMLTSPVHWSARL
jgi:hypothetical protein